MPKLAQVVFRKELRETLRDRRVILGVIVSPLLLTPCLMAALFFFAGKKTIEQQTSTLEIGLYQQASLPELAAYLEKNEGLALTDYPTREAAIEAVKTLAARAIVVVPHDAPDAFNLNASAPVEIIYSQANENSANALNRLRSILRKFNQEQTATRLATAGLEESFIRPTTITETSIADEKDVVGLVLSLFLPYIVIMGAAFGGINTAFDLCAGEKERGTLETLLVSPVSRYDIVKGKLLAIFSISLLSALCSILGLLIVLLFGGELSRELLDQELAISYANLAAAALVVVPLSLFTSAGLLLVSSFARNQKEAQAYIFPFIALMLFPAALSFVFGAESPLYVGLIPVLNIAVTMKQLLSNVFDLPFFVTALGSSFAYAMAATRLAVSLFQRETILFRS